MDADVAASEVVPRFVDLALFLCGVALRNLRHELPPLSPAAVRLHEWYLHHVCFLHALPNDDSGDVRGDDVAADLAVPPPVKGEGKEVNFHEALAQLRPSTSDAVGRVHARSASSEDTPAATFSPSPHFLPAFTSSQVVPAPRDVGFTLIGEFLSEAREGGGSALMRRVAAALADTLREKLEVPSDTRGAVQIGREEAAVSAPSVSVATLSRLFDEDLLDDELSMEAGNATRSFHIWVNYEWCSASFLRQTRLAAVASRWLPELLLCSTGEFAGFSPFLRLIPTTALSVQPTNFKEMCAALQSVFEGHTQSPSQLMEMTLTRCAPHLTDNALAKLLFLQGPSLASRMSRSELTNRGTQPILASITSGMLLYTQYSLSFRSLAVARQCVRVALQVAQEVHSNTVLALAHFTAHVVAAQQGRPADAANSISIALQLCLGSGGLAGDGAGSADVADGGVEAAGAPSPCVDGQLAAIAFAGAAQLLLFFPGAVSAALRSVLSTGRLADAAAPAAVSVQSVAQSVRHALLRAETAQMQAAPLEGQWVGVVASLHRETLLLLAALYGVVSTPTAITTASLGALLREVRREAAVASPLFTAQGGRTLFWEVLRHAAHHALALLEHLLLSSSPPTKSGATAALECLHAALGAIRAHYGPAGVAVASGDVFFSAVVRCCAASRLCDEGYTAAAYHVFTAVGDRLCRAAGQTETGEAGDGSCWPPDHLLLYAVVQRRRAAVAAFLGLLSVPPAAQQALLDVSAHHAFAFGVVTAQLMEAQTQQHSARYTAALAAAGRVEEAARRIGLWSVAEAACALRVSAHVSGGDWVAARRVLLRLHPRHYGLRVFVLLQKFSVHLELLLAATPVVLRDVQALTRSWLALVAKEGLLLSCKNDAHPVKHEISLTERLCLLSTVSRERRLLGGDVTALREETVACMRAIEERQGLTVPDVYVQGNCEEVCVRALDLCCAHVL